MTTRGADATKAAPATRRLPADVAKRRLAAITRMTKTTAEMHPIHPAYAPCAAHWVDGSPSRWQISPMSTYDATSAFSITKTAIAFDAKIRPIALTKYIMA